MPVPSKQIPDDEKRADGPRRSRAERARTVGIVVLAVLVTLFAVLNTNKVSVDWVVGSGHAPLIVVIAISVLVGIVLARLAERLAARRRR
jgi:uncharacterized integral membrane protein